MFGKRTVVFELASDSAWSHAGNKELPLRVDDLGKSCRDRQWEEAAEASLPAGATPRDGSAPPAPPG